MNQNTFQTRFDKLNPAQKQAVTKIDGPVMVLAGPGTGKTEILAARIAYILSSPDAGAEPHNILCLTYTEAGTIAMRKRLLEFIGPAAYQVGIYTFHSFCNEVIQQNLDYFGKYELQPLSDLEKLQYIQEIVDNFSSNHPLFQKYGSSMVLPLKNLFETMKSEDWSAVMISEAIDSYLADLPNREEFIYKRATGDFKKGDLKIRDIEAETEKMEKLRSAAFAFESYEKKLKEKSRYDYQDMILWVIRAFKEHEHLLARYQEQYQYILVDEYQDTNGSQNEIIKLLTSYWEVPNIFAVGDDDQSIYRFQGANVKNIMEFYERYREHLKLNESLIVLTENYRSTQNILNTAHYLISNNNERLTHILPFLQKKLEAKNPKVISSSIVPKIWEFQNPAQEEAGIFEEIERLRDQGVNLSDIAVLYNQHKQAANLIKLCEQKGIPLNVKLATNILELPIIQQILILFKYFALESKEANSAEHLLFEILHFSFFGIHPQDIAEVAGKIKIMSRELRVESQQSSVILNEAERSEGSRNSSNEAQDSNRINHNEILRRSYLTPQDDAHTSWRSALHSPSFLDSLDLKSREKLEKAIQTFDELILLLSNVTLQEFFEALLTRCGVLESIMKSDEKAWLLQVVTTFFQFLKDETSRESLKLHEFLETIRQMEYHNIRIPLSKIMTTKNGINFITAHSSKGLEYTHVFVIGATKDTWDKKGRSSGFAFPDTLIRSNDGDHIEEARRLFFVAITRAKEQLILSYPKNNDKGAEMESSQFVLEIREDSHIIAEQKQVSENTMTEYQYLLLKEKSQPHIETLEKEFLKDLLKDYRMSATHLNKYLKCPISFYYENILRVPTAKNTAMSFGTAMHYGLEEIFKHAREQGVGSKESMLAAFEKSLSFQKASFTDTEYTRYLEYGKKTLSEYFDRYRSEWNPYVRVEQKLSNIQWNGIPLSGKLDKIIFDGDQAHVVDYKTGKYSNAKYSGKLSGPDARNEFQGGDYWRQMVFYKILLDHAPQQWNMISGEMDFLEPEKGEFKKETYIITEEDRAIVAHQIEEVYAKIMNHEFSEGCGEEDCIWCNFARTYSLREIPKVEELIK